MGGEEAFGWETRVLVYEVVYGTYLVDHISIIAYTFGTRVGPIAFMHSLT